MTTIPALIRAALSRARQARAARGALPCPGASGRALLAEATRRTGLLALLVLTLAGAALLAGPEPAAAQAAAGAEAEASPYGGGDDYRVLLGMDGKWLNPRTFIWVLAQLHLLFAAFVLAVPMFAVIIELVGRLTKDPVQARRYDELAHEFTRLLTVAFSATAIVGAIFTFLCLGLYPKFFNYLVDVFGPSMYLYACIFFGESFSLYLYYYGWGKMRKWLHLGLGVMLNVFGITLMLIANAWTTFMMAPDGVTETGAVVSRYDAFFNFLLHPINIHRLIANLCMGGSVAAAYAAFKWLSTRDPEQRAHYDWMGYIGNFIAILALLPLPFAGYYLGFEIYAYNQQLGIYMMGGVLSWLFIMQAVLIGALFLAANYYLWLAMDRIEGSERYRGWIKYLLAVITVGVLIWSTPKTLILTSNEITEMGGTFHEVFGNFGVMSAKNTAVNFIILATFLSFLLYRRGNKEPTVSWAPIGKMIQVGAFVLASAVVLIIGIGGYIPGWWLESTKRVAMSPWQVVAVLACMVVCIPVDVLMFRNAKEIGRIRWGEVSARSQYTLIFLAVSFTWLMGLMGFVRSSLRQHWHVYEVMPDESPWAFTPSIGYATWIITACVLIFFALVSVIFWITSLGARPAAAEDVERPPVGWKPFAVAGGLAAAVVLVAAVAWVFGLQRPEPALEAPWRERVAQGRQSAEQALADYGEVEPGVYSIPVERAMKMIAAEPELLEGKEIVRVPWAEMSLEERGKALFEGLAPDPEVSARVIACKTCHSTDGSRLIGPTFQGRWGEPAPLTTGESVTFDAEYVRESIENPLAKIAEGFPPAMPPMSVTDEEMEALIAYIRGL